MSIVDQNEKPIPSTNGANHSQDTHDVRSLPTGTLIYNLIRFTGEEVGLENVRHQLQMAKQQQKLVSDPPQLTALEEHLGSIQRARYIIAHEINERFADVDKMRVARLGIEIVEPEESPVKEG